MLEIDPILSRLCASRGLGSTDQDYVVMYAVARSTQARRIVEIGTHIGASGICLLRAALDNGYDDAHLWTMDNWQGPEGGAPGSAPQLKVTARQSFEEAGLAKRVTMLDGNSRDLLPALFAEIGRVDLVLIDGEHLNDEAWKDFETSRQFADRILFHDSGWASVRRVLGRVRGAGWTVTDFPTCFLEGDGHPVGIALATAPGQFEDLPDPHALRMDGFATHVPVLLACLLHTDGPILELGAGLFSTPIVHAFSVFDRYARTVEADAAWARQVGVLFDGAPPYFKHDLLVVPDARDARLEEHRWSVALVDHGASARAPDLELLRTLKPELIVIHDSDDAGYRLGPILDKFAHRFDYTRLRPATSVVSDVMPLGWLEAAVRPLW